MLPPLAAATLTHRRPMTAFSSVAVKGEGAVAEAAVAEAAAAQPAAEHQLAAAAAHADAARPRFFV